MKLHSLLFLGMCVICVCGCQTFNLVPVERERIVDQQGAAETERQKPLLRDVDIAAYVSDIGRKVSQRSPRQDAEYSFKVIDSPEVNAFTYPYGSIYIYTGLLERLSTEAELAAVLGHEIGHVTEHHFGERFTQAMVIGTVSGIVLKSASKESLEQVVAGFIGKGVMGQYSQEAEREADSLGAQYAYAAGYNPDAAISLMTVLKKEEDKYSGNNLALPFFGSHPPAANRIENLKIVLARYSEQDRASRLLNKERYQQKVLSRLNPDAYPPEPQALTRGELPSVNEIQAALRNAGFYSGAVDGVIGPNTKNAIVEFQRSQGLAADGKVGPATWQALRKHLN